MYYLLLLISVVHIAHASQVNAPLRIARVSDGEPIEVSHELGSFHSMEHMLAPAQAEKSSLKRKRDEIGSEAHGAVLLSQLARAAQEKIEERALQNRNTLSLQDIWCRDQGIIIKDYDNAEGEPGYLDAQNRGIHSLDGIEHFINELDVRTVWHVNFSHNCLSSFPTDGLAACSYLKKLNISNNQLTALPPLGDFKRLEHIIAENNAITCLDLQHTLPTTTMKTIRLAGNRIDTIKNSGAWCMSFEGNTLIDLDDNPLKRFPIRLCEVARSKLFLGLRRTQIAMLPYSMPAYYLPCGGEIDVCEIKNIKCKQVTEFQLACNRQRPIERSVIVLGGTAKNKGVREKRDNWLKKF